MSYLRIRIPILAVLAGLLCVSGVHGAEVSGNQTGVWSLSGSPYLVIGQVTVPADETLEVEPGVVVKFEADQGMDVHGTLTAQGTEGSPVVFTAWADDEGGDTNGDGNASAPAADAWNCIDFAAGSDGTLAYCEIRYAGSWEDAAVVVRGDAAPVLSYSEISRVGGDGIRLYDTARPALSPSLVFSEIGGLGVSNRGTNEVLATDAWWGDASGPYHAELNPTGTGYGVSDNVVFAPYMENSPELWRELPVEDIVWGSQVVAFSTQYNSTSWAAARVLERPSVYPNYGDLAGAWASATEDSQREFLEVGFSTLVPMSGIRIYETYNPGAIDRIEARDEAGELHLVWQGRAAAAAPEARVFALDFPTTAFNVSSLLVSLNSPAVPGYNELDAIGLVPAEEPGTWYGLQFASATDGDWEQTQVALYATPEAALMVRTGDLDNFGFGWPVDFDPFSGATTPVHSWPWVAEDDDPAGTDRIMVISSYDGNPPQGGSDGYSTSTQRPENAVEPLSLSYELGDIQVEAALLQLFVDDFQAPEVGSHYRTLLDDRPFPDLDRILNALNQTGPVGRLITVTVPADLLSELDDGMVSLRIDDQETGAGDGFAIDFARLLINPSSLAHLGMIAGTVTDAEGGQPIAGAVISAGTLARTVTDSTGAYELVDMPAGLAVVTVQAQGYQSRTVTVELLAEETAGADFVLAPAEEQEPPAADINVPADFATIQEAIDAAAAGQTIFVAAGFYAENIELKEGVSVIGSGMEETTIDGGGSDVVWGADNATIRGFTLRNGGDSGVFAWSTSPRVEDCYITACDQGIVTAAAPTLRGNVITGVTDYAIFVGSSSSAEGPAAPIIANNLIVGNPQAAGITLYQAGGMIINNTIDANGQHGIDASPAEEMPVPLNVRNNIVTNNGWEGMSFGAFADAVGAEPPVLEYNDVWNNGWGDYDGVEPLAGALSADPLFVNPIVPEDDAEVDDDDGVVFKRVAIGIEDVASRNRANQERAVSGPVSAVRVFAAKVAVADSPEFDYGLASGSPCIDAGDPDEALQDVDGTRNDLGAFGGPLPLGSVPESGEPVEPDETEDDVPAPLPVGDLSFSVTPATPTSVDSLMLTLAGDFSAANAVVSSHLGTITENQIQLVLTTAWEGETGAAVITPWAVDEALGVLAAGEYQVSVAVNDEDFELGSFTVTEAVITPVAASPVVMDFDMDSGDQEVRRAGGAEPGKTYELQLHVTDAPDISGWSVKIEYDPAQVRFVSGSFQASNFIPGLLALADSKPEYVSVGGTLLGSGASNSGDGLLGTVAFEVLESFADSTQLVISEVSFRRTDGEQDVRTVQGTATITAEQLVSALAGDFNGDDTVDFADFFLFADAFGQDVEAGSPYDMSGDGTVDFSDFFLFADAFGSHRDKLIALAHELIGLPVEPVLMANYPNPFNGGTVIPVQLAAAGRVRVEVYNLLGQRIRTLFDGRLDAGVQRLHWAGVDDQGRRVTSGVYIYRLRADDHLAQRTMMLLR